jgi:hypothetical protein
MLIIVVVISNMNFNNMRIVNIRIELVGIKKKIKGRIRRGFWKVLIDLWPKM